MAAAWQYRAPLTGWKGLATPAVRSISTNSDSKPTCTSFGVFLGFNV